MRLIFFFFALIGFFSGSAHSLPEEENSVRVKEFYSSDIKRATFLHISNVIDANNIFSILDEETGEILKLKFIKIHDPVRQISDEIYFACTDFHVLGEPEKIYDVDFRLDHNNVNLSVFQVKIHKEPRRSILYGWYKYPRYTFVNDEIEYLY